MQPRRLGPILAGSLVALLLGSCASTGSLSAEGGTDPALLRERLDRSSAAYAAQEYKEAQHLAEDVLTETVDGKILQEALYLAGRARLARGHYRKAYRRFETLLQDYPYSDFLLKAEDDVYWIGMEYISRSPNWLFGDLASGRSFGSEVLLQYAVSYSSKPRADDALFEVAQYYESRDEWLLAAGTYEQIRDVHQESEWMDLASYRIGVCYQRACRGAGYDDTKLEQARRELRDYLARGLEGHRAEAEETLREVEEELARAELAIADFYRIREQDRGHRMHLANAVLAYPDTEAAQEAREELAERGWDVSVHSLGSRSGVEGSR